MEAFSDHHIIVLHIYAVFGCWRTGSPCPILPQPALTSNVIMVNV